MKPMVLSEVKRQLWLAGPMIAGELLQYALQMISIMFAGHLGELSLSGASLATSFVSITGFGLLIGGASAMDTLCGQAYGAKEYHLVGIYKQRAMIILTLISIPLSIILFYTEQILHFCHQTSEISLEAGVYAKWMVPSLFGLGLLECHVRFLQTQNIVFPRMISSGFTVVMHVFVCWVLVYKLGMGSKGAALASGISYLVNAGILAVYIRVSKKCSKTWVGFSKEGCRDLIGYVKLAIPSALMLCLSWWSFEFMVLLAGLLPNPQLETSPLSIILNMSIFIFMIPCGLGAAISTRVSNELGAGQPQAAKLAVFVVLVLAITQGLIMGLVLIFLRNIWGHAYSNKEEVIKYVAIMLPFVSISNILDGIQGVLIGVVRGCGLQKFGAWVNLGAFYIVGIPCAILLAFVAHLGGKMISVMFVGHLGELSLAGASMATSFASVTGFSLLLGGASAMDTLCGQAYGAKEYHLVGIYKQRAMIILTLLSIPLSLILFYTGQILHFCHQTSEISLEAGVYAKWIIPSLFAFGLLQCHVRFLHTQNIVLPSMISNGFTVVIHVFVCWILVYKLGMGSKGQP